MASTYRRMIQAKNTFPGEDVFGDMGHEADIVEIGIQMSPEAVLYDLSAWLVEIRQEKDVPGISISMTPKPGFPLNLDWKVDTDEQATAGRYVFVHPPAGLILLDVVEIYGDGQPTPMQPPTIDAGPQLFECTFPPLSWNLVSLLSSLFEWIGCMLHNIIAILKWLADWLLHFTDHLDAWISRLFGVDPSLPFFDEIMKKIDIWISGKFGIDPALPFWEELVKKALGWIAGALDAAAENRRKDRGW